MGQGGLHIFIKLLNGLSSRVVLGECYKKGVVFTPGDIFYTDDSGTDTMRLGFSRVNEEDIKKGIKIIGDVVKELIEETKNWGNLVMFNQSLELIIINTLKWNN